MAIKNTNFGGTDWSVEGLNNTDLNDTFDAAYNFMPYRKDVQATDTTEYSAGVSNSSPGNTIKSYTFTPENAEDILLAFKCSFSGKKSSTSDTVGYIVYIDISAEYSQISSTSATYETLTASLAINRPPASSYILYINGYNISSGGATAYVKDIQFTVFWLRGNSIITTTSSGKFS